MKTIAWIAYLFFLMSTYQLPAEEAKSITQYGITWTFDKAYPTGQFCTGDYWVVGPVKVIGITNNMHTTGFTPKPGEDGSMVNPGTDEHQGYCPHVTSGGQYQESLNASLVGGKAVAADNPLVLPVNSSLVSMVSWLYRSETDSEPGTSKRFEGNAKVPSPCTRTGAVLTVLPVAPPPGSFRPPYCGKDKTVSFNFKQLDFSKLKNLSPVADTPNPDEVAKLMERPWIDHVYQCYGALVHPSENMPPYGRDLATLMGKAALLVHLDFSKLPGSPKKDKLLISLVQLGIDNTGIADNGGGWPGNGGHLLGRKWPILFAGVMLNDPHMKKVGEWKTLFQEDEQTFFVTQADVDITHSPEWKPDKRAKTFESYVKEDIGLPEWGPHAQPQSCNKAMTTPYRGVNSPVYPGFVLAARIMGQEDAWNHKALFDYTDRWMNLAGSRNPYPFLLNMWKTYGKTFGGKE